MPPAVLLTTVNAQDFERERQEDMEIEQTGPLNTVCMHNQCFFNNIITLTPLLSRFPPTGWLPHCIKNWQAITTHQWVLQAVRGYRLDLMSPPTQMSQPLTMVTKGNQALVGGEVQKLLDKEAIKAVSPCSNQYVSRILILLSQRRMAPLGQLSI